MKEKDTEKQLKALEEAVRQEQETGGKTAKKHRESSSAAAKESHPLASFLIGLELLVPAVSAQPAAVANKESTKEDTAMKKTLKVEGMMCGHCEARVKKALEALPEVDEAVVSHEAGTAIVTLNAEVADDVLKKAVEDQDYPVTGIQ